MKWLKDTLVSVVVLLAILFKFIERIRNLQIFVWDTILMLRKILDFKRGYSRYRRCNIHRPAPFRTFQYIKQTLFL